MNTYANRPRMYYRYVDDTIAAIKKTNIDDFHQLLNSLTDTHIQFTIERYKDTGIPFLDTLNFVEVDMSESSIFRFLIFLTSKFFMPAEHIYYS